MREMDDHAPFSWESLGQFKAAKRLPEQYPSNIARFFAPDDDVKGALLTIVKSARVSIAVSMYGYDLAELDELLRDAWQKEGLPVQICLDKTQAAGTHEKELLAAWPTDQFGNRIVIGQSRKHAINHLKLFVIDGIYTIGGSTNLSDSGLEKQNNEMIIIRDPVYAAESRAKIDLCHSEMESQMISSGQIKG